MNNVTDSLMNDIAQDAENKKAAKTLLFIYSLQTSEEREDSSTYYLNTVGFNAFDADFASSLCRQLLEGKDLSDKQWYHVRRLAKRYSKQEQRVRREMSWLRQ